MLKRLHLVFLCYFVTSIALAGNMPSPDTNVIPLKLISGYPAIDANIQGKTVPLLIDTGAETGLLLKEQARKKFKLVIHKKTTRFGNACGGQTTYQAFTLSSLKVGNSDTENIDGYLYNELPGCAIKLNSDSDKNHHSKNLSQQKQDPRHYVDGSLGIDFFIKKQVIFDIANKKLVFFNKSIPQDYSSLNWQWFSFNLENNEILVNATIQNKNLSLMVDTGGGYSMLNPALDIKPNHPNCTLLSTDQPNCKILSLPELNIGPAKLGKFNFIILENINGEPLPFDGILGIDFFKQNIVLLDFVNLKIAVAKP